MRILPRHKFRIPRRSERVPVFRHRHFDTYTVIPWTRVRVGYRLRMRLEEKGAMEENRAHGTYHINRVL